MTQAVNYTEDRIEAMVKEQIVKEFMYDKESSLLTNDYPLIEQGIIDSMGVIRMIGFLEDNFKITVDPEDVLLEYFETVKAIKSFVINKLKGVDNES
ncbi:MAG: acyl carrier protein [Xenococcus sp. MO_188.B8]|nr:acyl carrier protein [Xenococcus sp. MO_188.B8]